MSSHHWPDRAGFLRRLSGALLSLLSLPLPHPASASGDEERSQPDQGKKFRLLDHPQVRRNWVDRRSRRVVFLAHCVVNQNARMHDCANHAAAVQPIVDWCLDRGLGIVQLPCPELLVVGLGRDRDDPPQEYLEAVLRKPQCREPIRKLAETVVYQVKEYRFQGFEVLAVVGSDGSPSCGVDRTAFPDAENRFGPGQGVFIAELRELLRQEGLELPFKGMDDLHPEETVAWLERLCQLPPTGKSPTERGKMIEFRHIYDISLVLGQENPVYPGDTPFQREETVSFARGGDYQYSRLALGAHSGTHLDLPRHFIPEARTMEQYPAERFIMPAQVVEIPDSRWVERSHLEQKVLPRGEALLFKTRNSRSGISNSPVFHEDFACLSLEAAQYCLEKQAPLVGIDYLSVDGFGKKVYPVHELLMKQEVLILEGLNLKEVPEGAYTLLCLPLRIAGAEASPVRAVLLR